MLKELRNILIILTPVVILAFYVGQRMTSDAAAIAVGAGLGIAAAALFALITAIIRDEQRQRARREASRPRRQPEHGPAKPTIITGQWRDLPAAEIAAPRAEPVAGLVEAPGRTIYLPADRDRS